MKHLRRIFLKFSLHFANSKVEADLAREIGAHLAFLEDEYLRQGMTPEDARRAARLAYGGVEQATQLHRDERAFQGLGHILQDTRYTFRQLCRSPGSSAPSIFEISGAESCVSLKRMTEVREITRRSWIPDSRPMSSSVIPSARYS